MGNVNPVVAIAKEVGISARMLSDATGLSYTTCSSVLSGSAHRFQMETAEIIAKYFGFSVNELFKEANLRRDGGRAPHTGVPINVSNSAQRVIVCECNIAVLPGGACAYDICKPTASISVVQTRNTIPQQDDFTPSA